MDDVFLRLRYWGELPRDSQIVHNIAGTYCPGVFLGGFKASGTGRELGDKKLEMLEHGKSIA